MQQLMATTALSGGSDKHSHHPLDAAMEQEALDRMRMSINYHNHGLRHPSQQQRLLYAGASWDDGAGASASQLLEDEVDEVEDPQLEEVMAAIKAQDKQREEAAQQRAAKGAPPAAVDIVAAVPRGGSADGFSMLPPSEEASLPADPWDMSDGEFRGSGSSMDVHASVIVAEHASPLLFLLVRACSAIAHTLWRGSTAATAF